MAAPVPPLEPPTCLQRRQNQLMSMNSASPDIASCKYFLAVGLEPRLQMIEAAGYLPSMQEKGMTW